MCVCVAVSSWVCRSIVSRFVRLVRSSVWGLVPRLHLVGILSLRFANDARSQEHIA